MGRDEESGMDSTTAESASTEKESFLAKPTGPKWRIPLAVLLLFVTIFVAAAIVIPVAVLAFNGADETVDQILSVLKANYIQQVNDKVTTQLAVAYELAQVNAASVSIRQGLDSMVPGTPFNFSAQPQMQYQYRKNVERSNFLISSGFARSDNHDLLVISAGASPGLLCYYEEGAVVYPYPPPAPGVVTNSTCKFFLVKNVYPNCTVDFDTASFSGLPPIFSPQGLNNSVGYWDAYPYFAPTAVPGNYIGVFSFHWSQWKGLDLGQKDPVELPIGSQLVTVGFEIFSKLLQSITTTPNTAIAIWLTHAGSLLATNIKDQSVLDPSSLDQPFAQAYTPDKVPQPSIAMAAASLKAKYGDIFGKDYTPALAMLPPATSDVFTGPNGLDYVETYEFTDNYGFQVTIMLVIPQADLLGPMASTRKKILATSLVIAFAMLAFAAATSVFVTQPVRRLTTVMRQATNMDFSALTGGYLASPPWIRELALMQDVFGTMLKRFAAAIAANKSLQGTSRQAASGVQHQATAATKAQAQRGSKT
ncbi:hypothetical protein HDU88_001585 [Geranomyces variabilis]|nr:hypothetical protein HDU88_001585 [Geranomyces variabilis]